MAHTTPKSFQILCGEAFWIFKVSWWSSGFHLRHSEATYHGSTEIGLMWEESPWNAISWKWGYQIASNCQKRHTHPLPRSVFQWCNCCRGQYIQTNSNDEPWIPPNSTFQRLQNDETCHNSLHQTHQHLSNHKLRRKLCQSASKTWIN